jgi:transcriptional repressor NrdR
MRCPFCRHEDTQVVDSRVSEDGAAIRRRRRCPACDKRFTTYERVELAMPAVVKKDGSRTEYDRRKMVASMKLALRKRPVSADAIDAAVARIEYQLLGSGEREVRSERLGELVMAELRELDKVAFVRFASVYRRFEDVSEFEDVIEEFRRMAGPAAPKPPARKR